MSISLDIQEPALCWLKQRARFINDTQNWDWVLNDPVVGHLAPVLHLLHKEGILLISNQSRQAFSNIYWDNKARWVKSEYRIREILSELYNVGVAVIPLKGSALQGTVYKDVGLRSMSDIDVLVNAEQFLFAAKILIKLGMTPETNNELDNIFWFENLPRTAWPKSLILYDPKGLEIELHQTLAATWFLPGFRLNLDSIWGRSILVSDNASSKKSSHRYMWRNLLSPYDELAFLCLHSALHGFQMPRSFQDVDLWLRNIPENWDWNQFLKIANEWEIRSAVYHVFSFCKQFMDTPLPEGFLDRLDPGWFARSRIRLLITPVSMLANDPSIGMRYPALVKLAVIDHFPRLLWTLMKLLFPGKTWAEYDPKGKKNYFSHWLHVLAVALRGD